MHAPFKSGNFAAQKGCLIMDLNNKSYAVVLSIFYWINLCSKRSFAVIVHEDPEFASFFNPDGQLVSGKP